jgi:hypothetical protein
MREGEYFFNFIVSPQIRIHWQLLFILKDQHEPEHIFHIGSHCLNISL